MAASTPERTGEAERGRADAVEVFRPSAWLRGVVYGAVVLWVSVLFLLFSVQGVAERAYFSAAFFVLLFTILGVFYNRTSIAVTRDALIWRSIASFRRVPFRDVLKIEVKPGMMQTNYSIRAKQGLFMFTNLFSGHERLMHLIVERARLGRM